MPVHYLRSAGTSLILDARGHRTPVIVHWGRDIGELSTEQVVALADSQIPGVAGSSVDASLRATLLPLGSDGWSGHPGLTGFTLAEAGDSDSNKASGRFPAFELVATSVPDGWDVQSAVQVELSDDVAHLSVVVTLSLSPSGVLESRTQVTNTGTTDYELVSLISTLPLPMRATEIMDLSGRWPTERRPQRLPVRDGTWLRETRHGRPGHDAPFATVVGTPGFGFRTGEVWMVHHAWSGDTSVRVEHRPTGHTVVGAGETWGPRDVVVKPGETYESPRTLAAWSGDGMDGASERFHGWVRARPVRATKPRPITLNTWEAVYFNHDLTTLRALADAGATAGVERFVLDDGWFHGRRDDKRGLGDWTVDNAVWPEGLHPLVDHVTGLGMSFGLWVEPEMVNADSDVARVHPDWILRGAPGRDPLAWRHQQILDLANPEAYEYVRDALVALLEEYSIEYFKWDQNRDVIDAPSRPQVLATRRLMDELRERFPALEIESCSSGGGKVDLDVLDRTDRVWASDTNDPLERQSVQRWTGLLVPPELVGTHVGDARAHTTGRTQSLGLRLATALFGHSGIESDITQLSEGDLDAVTRWIAQVKELRSLIATGTTVRADRPDETLWVHGIVAPDKSEGVFTLVSRESSPDALPAPAVLPGLAADRTYRVEVLDLAGPPLVVGDAAPPWCVHDAVELTGTALAEIGLPLPPFAPEQGVVLRVRLG